MKALRLVRTLTSTSSRSLNPALLSRLFSAQPQHSDSEPDSSNNDSVFDSSHFTFPTNEPNPPPKTPTWNPKYRERTDKLVFGIDAQKEKVKGFEEDDEKNLLLAKALLEAALEKPDDDDDDGENVREEDQKSLSVGIIGAPNAGKSALTNFMVGTKVSAVSRKTNTTIHEVLGVMTKGDTQICFFDTPGLLLKNNGYPRKCDINDRVTSVWSAIDLYDVLMVIFDVHRHLTRPDKRVIRLINHVGAQANPKQKRVLCMNKVDLVEKKKDLLKVAQEFKDLPGYERSFMISGLKGAGVKDLSRYLMEQAVKRPWNEDLTMSEDVMKNISLEVVRERLLDHVHQEIPYAIEHRLMDWKELKDGSLRIEQHLITHKPSQRKILVGKNGSKIGRIGIEANEELKSIFKRDIHLILQVRLKIK